MLIAGIIPFPTLGGEASHHDIDEEKALLRKEGDARQAYTLEDNWNSLQREKPPIPETTSSSFNWNAWRLKEIPSCPQELTTPIVVVVDPDVEQNAWQEVRKVFGSPSVELHETKGETSAEFCLLVKYAGMDEEEEYWQLIDSSKPLKVKPESWKASQAPFWLLRLVIVGDCSGISRVLNALNSNHARFEKFAVVTVPVEAGGRKRAAEEREREGHTEQNGCNQLPRRRSGK